MLASRVSKKAACECGVSPYLIIPGHWESRRIDMYPARRADDVPDDVPAAPVPSADEGARAPLLCVWRCCCCCCRAGSSGGRLHVRSCERAARGGRIAAGGARRLDVLTRHAHGARALQARCSAGAGWARQQRPVGWRGGRVNQRRDRGASSRLDQARRGAVLWMRNRVGGAAERKRHRLAAAVRGRRPR